MRRYADRNGGRMIHKWLHYFPVYERYLGRYRWKRLTMLEIGVAHGGSLQMWRAYFGPRARIVGADINPRVASLAERGIALEVGDQSDPAFLQRLVDRHGPFDVILDDGSHRPAHQIASITHLWPALAEGGTYIVEDLHTNYWPSFDGGPGRPDTFMAWLAERIDDMHAFHGRVPGHDVNDWTRTIDAVHVHDSMVVLEKRTRSLPVDRMTGWPTFDELEGTKADKVIDAEHLAQMARARTLGGRVRRTISDPVRAAESVARRVRRALRPRG